MGVSQMTPHALYTKLITKHLTLVHLLSPCPKPNSIYYIGHITTRPQISFHQQSTIDISQTTHPLQYIGHLNTLPSPTGPLWKASRPHAIHYIGHLNTTISVLPSPVYCGCLPEHTLYRPLKHNHNHNQSTPQTTAT